MGAKAKTKKLTENDLITMYMDHVLEHESRPKSVYKFCKLNSISEADFYAIFGSLESIPKRIWNVFFENTEDLLLKNKEFEGFSNKDKMLTFFYSFFELLTLNRSYVLLALHQENNPLKNLEQLKGLRKHIKNFATVLIEDDNSNKTLKATKFNPKLFSEGAWFQFLFLLKFWKDDESKGFEKTDMAIEKSVNTIFDVFDNTPLENIIDFGKFLYKETFV
ncbi:TetR/AcrR family transcriptional regulator [Maribacter polysiphoniae]|uniref:AcrR family transcriptional regulator n=1 Tax=Maribacter polysiphoniae TaxID=429344 RepID=A0A316E1Q9_9FLAO|nr:TetR family transcriptional regulator C-terminal domain-containing protein [Maribacter polysiphoniae]MBD1260926.1 TetR/AcrR family transcriptional regulator [Maribacter polysiphoniae]PWK23936.1 AcrR family transcriptional regulator [Maribacter polysiphoniae]